MTRNKELIREIHRRSLWHVLGIYLVASWVVFQVIQTLTEGLGLPDWFPAFALVLLLVGLPIVLATAFVQESVGRVEAQREAEPSSEARATGADTPTKRAASEGGGVRQLFTWRNALTGGALAFGLWGVVATGWLLLSKPSGAEGTSAEQPPSAIKMLVVLPFENLGSSEQDYFADGITEEITSRLAVISGLGVISRTSAIQYKNTDKGLPEIGEELGVEYVVEGTVLWQQRGEGPSRVRVTPQLIRVADNTHVWADRYDAVLEDIFEVQSEIATQIIDALGVALLEPERRSVEARPTESLEAYDYYLRGREYYTRSSARVPVLLAIQLLEKAIEFDPNFALAYANLSLAHDLMYWFHERTDERRAEFKRTAERALQLDPDLPDAHIAMGYYYYHGLLDYEQALDELAIARRGRPNDSELWAVIGYVQRRQGKWDDAATSLDKALQLDPRSTRIAWNQCWTYTMLQEYSKAEPLCDRAISLAPDVTDGYVAKVTLYTLMDGGARVGEVLREASLMTDRATLIVSMGTYYRLTSLFRVHEEFRQALAGLELDLFGLDTVGFYLSRTSVYGQSVPPELERAYYDSARAYLEPRVAEWSGDVVREARGRSSLGLAYAGLGRTDEAVREGEKSVELLPVSKNAIEGAIMIGDLAQIYIMLDEYDSAIEQLQYWSSIPSYMSKSLLRADPLYDPLRDHPRFQALLEREE